MLYCTTECQQFIALYGCKYLYMYVYNWHRWTIDMITFWLLCSVHGTFKRLYKPLTLIDYNRFRWPGTNGRASATDIEMPLVHPVGTSTPLSDGGTWWQRWTEASISRNLSFSSLEYRKCLGSEVIVDRNEFSACCRNATCVWLRISPLIRRYAILFFFSNAAHTKQKRRWGLSANQSIQSYSNA